MPEYTIAAIPTLYRGRMYRSRLEARWAAFFDRLGWTYEYEPFDLGKWSPDFLLPGLNLMVEVKPFPASSARSDFDFDAWGKISQACLQLNRPESILLLPVSPIFRTIAQIGWLGFPEDEFKFKCEAWLGYFQDYDRPKFITWLFAISDPGNAVDPIGWRFPDGEKFKTSDYWVQPYVEHVEALWADACNAVQWEPSR